MEEKISDSLLAFIDFLYAVVFGLVLAEAYEEIINSETLGSLDKLGGILLVISVFYFLSWDWLHGRLLTLRNPYTRYRRFFIETLIAFFGYGAAISALQRNIFFLVYVSFVLWLGASWAFVTLREYPQSDDIRELKITETFQSASGFGPLIVFAFHRYNWGYEPMSPFEIVGVVLIGWFFVFVYELRQERPYTGIMFGPGVPFVNRERLEKIKRIRKGGAR